VVVARELAVMPIVVRRGPGWVLAWAAACALILLVATLLLQFALLLVNERYLVHAARQALIEASLPRATHESVAAAAGRALGGRPHLASMLLTETRVNGRVQLHATPWSAAPGDVVTVRVATLASAVVPDWLAGIGLSLDGQVLQATVRRGQ
jgi:hypothetical protein